MSAVVFIGSQWGDEGKGKIVDHYAGISDYVVRYQGGSNAGHTLVINGKKIILHLIPAGILRDDVKCILSDNIVLKPSEVIEEIKGLKKAGYNINSKKLKISARAHVTMPYHITIDNMREVKRGDAKIGTTGKGIGPTYEDKAARRGIRVGDLIRPDILKERLKVILDDRNYYIEKYLEEKPLDFNKVYEETLKEGEILKPYICDTSLILEEACKSGKKVLFEGAQGVMLDLDGGTYPYVTSSNITPGCAAMSAGVSISYIKHVVGVVKAYNTRVGRGPMPTELTEETGDLLRFKGGEYGATTGRPRRCGWLDMVSLKHSARYSGLTSFILTKLDVLSGFPEIKVCTGYKINGKETKNFPYEAKDLENVTPIYKTFKGWNEETKGITSIDKLPENAKKYVNWIKDYLGLPLVMMSTGAGRGESIESYNPFEA